MTDLIYFIVLKDTNKQMIPESQWERNTSAAELSTAVVESDPQMTKVGSDFLIAK